MAAFTSIALGIGALAGGASMIYGASERAAGQRRAEQGYALQQQGSQIQAEAAQQRAGISKEQAAASVDYAKRNYDLEALAAQQSLSAAQQSQQINQSIISSERANEAQRMQAMELDARRKGLEVIRNQQRARSLALTNATASGSQRGSGLQGGYGQISGQSNTNMLGIQQNLDIGRNMFANNENISNQRIAMSDLETLYAQQRAAYTTARSQLIYDYAGVNAGFQTRMADTDTMMAQGQGLISQGGGMTSSGQMQMQSGSQFMQAGPQIFGMAATGANVFGGGFGGGVTPISSATSFTNWNPMSSYGAIY